MNKPATKEPSMDEILSSIRQIIADDDAASAPAPARPAPAPVAAAAPPAQPAPTPRPAPPPAAGRSPMPPEPLALSPSQMIAPKPAPAPEPVAPGSSDFSAMLDAVGDSESEVSGTMAEMLANDPQLIDPEDVAFEVEPEPGPAAPPAPPPPVMRAPEPPAVRVPEPRAASRPAMSVAQAAPMPDPTLSEDMAEQLLAPAAEAAAQGAMARLSALTGTGIGGMTVEAMIRDMLKPMLKDWLDENLPALVERMVEKEIARISRGVK